MAVLHQLAKRLERLETLDAAARPLAAAVGWAVRPRVVRNLLSGTNLGHPLHPVLTDLPIGAWSMSALLDTVGGPAAEQAADLLIGAGIATAVPTAAAGLNDWSDTYGPARRVGMVHAGANVTALALYTASLLARRTGARRRGKALALAGFGVLLASGYLGGHLTYAKAVNVNHTAFEELPAQWTPVLADEELPEGQARKVLAGQTPLLLHRRNGQVLALANTCTHMGGPLDEGKISDDCVTCPWHGSTFRFTDGGIVRGPASVPQPVCETRLHNGHIEVRARH